MFFGMSLVKIMVFFKWEMFSFQLCFGVFFLFFFFFSKKSKNKNRTRQEEGMSYQHNEKAVKLFVKWTNLS